MSSNVSRTTGKTILKRVVETTSRNTNNMKRSIGDRKHEQLFFDTVKKLKDQGLEYSEIVKLMGEQGWVSPTGVALNIPMVSKFMTDRGYRTYSSKNRAIKLSDGRPKSAFEKELIELLQTELSWETKADLAIALAQKHKSQIK
jgi:hypothetical protein